MKFPQFLTVPLVLMPLPLIQQATQLLFQRVLSAHAGLFERLGEYAEKRFAFVPTDLPLAFIVDPAKPSIIVRRNYVEDEADTGVEGPLFLLLALLEGRCDGDALFFSRDLVVTGDMEAMLAMRNALDDSDVDLSRDLSSLTGPLAPAARPILALLRQRVLEEEAA